MRAVICFLATVFSFVAQATVPATLAESCSVLAGSPPEMVAVPSISVLGLAKNDSFRLPMGLPANVSAVVCERSSIVPAEFDYKVLQAGLPFAIKVPDGNTLWLEINDGQVRVSYGEGALSTDELSRTQQWLDRIQSNFNKSETPSDKGGA